MEKGTDVSLLQAAVYLIRWAPQIAGLISPSNHPLVKSCLEGAKRKLAHPVQPKEPLSLELGARLCISHDVKLQCCHGNFSCNAKILKIKE